MVYRAKSKWYKHQNYEKLVLNSKLQTYQILTNEAEVLKKSYFSFILAVSYQIKTDSVDCETILVVKKATFLQGKNPMASFAWDYWLSSFLNEEDPVKTP